jgi:hypothetical protein
MSVPSSPGLPLAAIRRYSMYCLSLSRLDYYLLGVFSRYNGQLSLRTLRDVFIAFDAGVSNKIQSHIRHRQGSLLSQSPLIAHQVISAAKAAIGSPSKFSGN